MSRAAWAGFALLALGLVIARACLQSVVIDEADSWLLFAGKSDPALAWWPSSGNHVLNTLLMRLSTAVFGLNELTLRLPAICGAVIYLGSSWYACWRLASLPLFLCLIYNPLVLDFLVAARGYSLALAFLMAALAVIVDTLLAESPAEKPLLAVSVLVGLSFCANFSFGIADGVTLAAFSIWAWLHTNKLSVIAAGALPAVTVVFCICGYTLGNWPKGQLYFGSHSLYETARALIHSSYFELNPNIVHPLLKPLLERLTHLLWPVTVVLGLALLGRARTPLVKLLLSIAALTVLLHWLAFHLFGLLLPKQRTGLFFVPLVMMLFGALLAGSGPIARRSGAVLLTLNAICFLGCLRLSYFEEWKFDADAKQLYWTLRYFDRNCGVHRFVTQWYYSASLNFYRQVNHDASLPELAGFTGEAPLQGDAYVLFYPAEERFIQEQGLHMIYHGDASQAVVAVRSAACAKIEVP